MGTLSNAQLLIEAGANPDLTDHWGRTALDLNLERARTEPGHGGNRRSPPPPELISYLEAVTTPALAAAALAVAVSEDSSRSSNSFTGSSDTGSPEYVHSSSSDTS